MAIPNSPNNYYLQTANGQNLLIWDLAAGATSYSVQRSLDGVTFTTLATPATNLYLDAAVTLGIQYWYQVASVNVSGTSTYTAAQSCVPVTTGEFSLGAIRLAAQQRADRLGSNFVTLPEWNSFINRAMFELYDLLVTTYEDYFYAQPASFTADGITYQYNLPNGVLSFNDNNGNPFVAAPFYKLAGVDLALNTANNAFVTLHKFNFINRNDYLYPNSASTIYGVFNMRYRLIGNQIEFIPTPSGGQKIRLWYIPRLQSLLKDTDLTTIGISGWIEYVIVRAAKYALDKEESDTSKLDSELIFLKQRIEESAVNRDAGQPDTISNIRSTSGFGDGTGGWGSGYGRGGW